MDTRLDAVCVKRRAKTLQQLFNMRHSHGKLVNPGIGRGDVRGCVSQADADARLGKLIFDVYLSDKAVVMVRGHGWGLPGDKFVWTGTVKEFKRLWEID